MSFYRQRRPLTPQEFDLERARLADAYDACDGGGTAQIEALATLLGRHLVTPFFDDRPRKRQPPFLRACVYRTGASAALTAACARHGIDPEPYIAMMDAAAEAEAAIPAGSA